MTPHPDEEQISAWLDGEVSPDELRRIRHHLNECSLCRERRDALAAVADYLRPLREVSPPPVLRQRFLEEWRQRWGDRMPRRSMGSLTLLWAPAFTVALLFALFAPPFHQGETPSMTTTAPDPASVKRGVSVEPNEPLSLREEPVAKGRGMADREAGSADPTRNLASVSKRMSPVKPPVSVAVSAPRGIRVKPKATAPTRRVVRPRPERPVRRRNSLPSLAPVPRSNRPASPAAPKPSAPPVPSLLVQTTPLTTETETRGLDALSLAAPAASAPVMESETRASMKRRAMAMREPLADRHNDAQPFLEVIVEPTDEEPALALRQASLVWEVENARTGVVQGGAIQRHYDRNGRLQSVEIHAGFTAPPKAKSEKETEPAGDTKGEKSGALDRGIRDHWRRIARAMTDPENELRSI